MYLNNILLDERRHECQIIKNVVPFLHSYFYNAGIYVGINVVQQYHDFHFIV